VKKDNDKFIEEFMNEFTHDNRVSAAPIEEKAEVWHVSEAPVEEKVGGWHYVKTFCAFFSAIATVACVIILASPRTHFMGFIIGAWILGVISALIVAPGKFFSFGLGVLGSCITFGWYLLPFPWDILIVIFAAPIGLIVALFLMVVAPIFFTVYTYFKEIRQKYTDIKKELIAIEAPKMERSFDAVEIYERYAEEEYAMLYSEDILKNPVSVLVSDDGYNREYHYDFEQRDGNIHTRCEMIIIFEYVKGEWEVYSVNTVETPIGFDNVNGTWKGMGSYPGNLSSGNNYTVSLDLSQDGGNGTVDISCGDWSNHLDVTVQAGEITEGSASLAGALEEMVSIKLVLEEPLSFTVFGITNTYEEIDCDYFFDSNVLIMRNFAYGMILR